MMIWIPFVFDGFIFEFLTRCKETNELLGWYIYFKLSGKLLLDKWIKQVIFHRMFYHME